MMLQQLARAIFMSLAVTLPVWAVIRLVIIAVRKWRKKPWSAGHEVLLWVLFIYLVFVAAVTVVPIPISTDRSDQPYYINLVPVMKSLQCFLPHQKDRSELRMFCLKNVIGNVALFLPFGGLLPVLFRPFRSGRRVLIAALLFSASIETIQYFERFFGSIRSVDVDDVLLNTIGALIGYIFVAASVRE